MKITFLGTGTSTGIPQIGCTCETCRSLDPNDKRLRASALIEVGGKSLLVDAGPDLRTQLLRAHSPHLDALLITHSHFDHVGGLIDLRSYCYPGSFPVYCQHDVAEDLQQFFPYCFAKDLYPGVPTFDINNIRPFEPFSIGDVEILPVPVMHYKLQILGFRIGRFAYITDCRTMPDATVEALRGVDTLVINALRLKPHMSHMSLYEALALVRRIAPRCTYLTHMSHDMGPESSVMLPDGVHFAHDMLSIELREK